MHRRLGHYEISKIKSKLNNINNKYSKQRQKFVLIQK